MQPLRILILSDGRPGHFNLSEGIAAALGRLGPTTIARVDVRRGRWPGPVLAALANAQLPAATMLGLVYGIDHAELPAADVIVSAGAETLAANIWLARLRSRPNLFYGSLRHFKPTDFAVVLTSYARNAGLPRHMLALKPSAFDPDQVSAAERGAKAPPGHLPRRVALLIGGNAGTFTYGSDDWKRLLAFVPQSHAASGIEWLVSNSRRTPDEVSNRIAGLAGDPAAGIVRFIDVRTAGSGSLTDVLVAVDAVLCTDDSSSMISECIWARLPVVGTTPLQFHHTGDEAEYRRWLVASGWCRVVPIADLTPDTFLAAVGAITPPSENPLDHLAARLAAALPGLFAGG